MNRRTLLAATSVAVTGPLTLGSARRSRAQNEAAPDFGYPITLPGRAPGASFLIRHSYACENTWYNPGRLFSQKTVSGPSPRCMVTCHRGS